MVLIGLPGAGKSAVAPILAARLGRRSDDLDAAIERATGRSVPDLLRSEGEAAFRSREAATLRALLTAGAATLVLACGGGVVVGEASRALLESATVIWLRVTPETAWARLGPSGAATRPLLADRGDATEVADDGGALSRLRALQAAREPLYEAIADVAMTTDGRAPDDVAALAATWLREQWAASAS
ncbi:MAG TPA: shikimate kinase [Candidatus Eisenbacteria bacterium]|nr:shikimate kinase [Candidatus Eisenbacteria bacterium]